MNTGKTKYYVLKEKAVPEVLLKVIEAKKLMETGHLTVQEATERAGISRSSFYKYKDDIFPFHDNAKGKTITFLLQMDDAPGLLSDVLKQIACMPWKYTDDPPVHPPERCGVADDQRGYCQRCGRRVGNGGKD